MKYNLIDSSGLKALLLSWGIFSGIQGNTGQ